MSDRTDAAQSDLDARILRADLYRGDEFLWRYEFDLESEYYYWAGILGERFYFVGNYVKYMELGPLATEGNTNRVLKDHVCRPL